jgi:hypothetical protein
MSERLSRQSFLGSQSDEIFARSRAGIIGLGGGGSHVVQQLAHIGIGNFVIFDPDKVEESNLNRLVGATARDSELGTLKTVVARRMVKRVNPDAKVICVPKPWQEDSLHLRDCDIVFGCVDTYSSRFEIESFCRRFLMPFIDIGMDVVEGTNGYIVSGQVILSMPGRLCMRCLGFLNEDLLAQEAADYGAAGGRPQVVWPNGLLASAAVGLFVHLLTPWQSKHQPTIYLEYDGNSQNLLASNRLVHVQGKRCDHYSSSGLGDPFWPRE